MSKPSKGLKEVTPYPLLSVEDLHCEVSGKEILRGISFEVDRGDFVSIVGPNGAGKTTLLKCILGLVRQSAGGITLGGRRARDMDRRSLGAFMGYVPQSTSMNLPFTVYDLVMMGRYPHLSPFTAIGKGHHEVVEEALTLTDTLSFRDRHISTLSGGERQRVLIASAIAQSPELLILDEPQSFLDPKHEDEINGLLQRLVASGSFTIISTTHDINSAALMSTSVIGIKEGAAVFYGTGEEFMDDDLLYSIYDKRFRFVTELIEERGVRGERKVVIKGIPPEAGLPGEEYGRESVEEESTGPDDMGPEV